jgi:hypothetical protein
VHTTSEQEDKGLNGKRNESGSQVPGHGEQGGHEVATGMTQHERVVMARCPVGSSESCWQIDKVPRMVLYQRHTNMDVKKW